MKIVAIKIGKHWYRAVSCLPCIVECYPLFAVSRLRNETAFWLENKFGFNDIYKYAYYSMKTRQFHNLEKKPKIEQKEK